MKKILFIIALLFSTQLFAGNDPVIKDTVINHVTYHIYQGSRGGKYIIVTSKKGTTYKKYLTSKKS